MTPPLTVLFCAEHGVQVLDDPTVEVEVGRLNSSLGVVTEVVGQEESRDTALALEAVKVGS